MVFLIDHITLAKNKAYQEHLQQTLKYLVKQAIKI